MLDALIFDVDGTLAETEELHRHAFNDAFAEAGLGWYWSRETYQRLLRTTGGKERIARFVADTGADPVDVRALHAAKTERYTKLVAQGGMSLRDGIRPLIDEARAAGLRLAIATTTSRPNVEELCRAAFGRPAARVFDVLACGDEVAVKKPAPDIYLLALSRLGVPPVRCLALEDSQNGLRAAQGAGLACVISPSAYTRDEEFTGALAVAETFLGFGGLGGLAALIKDHSHV